MSTRFIVLDSSIPMVQLPEKVLKVKTHLESLGFFINDGIKYGMDLLAYTDSPSRVHSKYGVVVSDDLRLHQLVAYQRICTSNNKILLVAVVGVDGIRYYECRRFLPVANVSSGAGA